MIWFGECIFGIIVECIFGIIVNERRFEYGPKYVS